MLETHSARALRRPGLPRTRIVAPTSIMLFSMPMRDSKFTGPASTSQFCPSLPTTSILMCGLTQCTSVTRASISVTVSIWNTAANEWCAAAPDDSDAQSNAAPAETIRDEDSMVRTPQVRLTRAVGAVDALEDALRRR